MSGSTFTRKDLLCFLVLAALLLGVLPAILDPFRLNLFGKYVTYGFVALGLVMCWGDAGILSLGQGVFFGLGGYAMAMYLKLEASSPEATRIQSTPGIPDFMDWNQITALPWFWTPFRHLSFAMMAVWCAPVALAGVVGFAMFTRRVGGTYFAIITQAMASIMTILIIGQQGYTGGVNGMTDLRTLNGWDIRTDSAKLILYMGSAMLLLASLLLAHVVRRSKLGRILVAIRDREDRVRFSGYEVASFKVFVFCLAAALAGIGGAMFTLQVGFMSPSLVGIVPSIEMVIYCAVGGRTSIFGAVYGTLLVNYARTSFSERLPEAWLFAMGALFILVVVAFPDGLAGVWRRHADPWVGTGCSARRPGRLAWPKRRTRSAWRPADDPDARGRAMSETDFLLAVEGLSVSFDGFKAVDDLSFYVDPNEIRVIIGPNGAGKTTVLDLICGRTKASGGSIKFRGAELTAMKEHQIVRAGVGRKFQNPSIYEDLTVLENLEISFPRGRSVFGALAFRRDAEVRDRIEEVAGMIFLRDVLHQQAEYLSHGQKQWLEIGMLLIQDPALLMLDEPVAGMSVAERKKTAELLHRIIQHRSVLVIEHDMGFVADIAHKVTVLHQGRIISEGSMAHVQADPRVVEVYLGH